eukprot:Pompholyxophrys_sp_v1_NODE_136_length_1649_cov_15.867001.p1 type:complete len:346 gc:universal NODE_136_length_1649_cov_15.867001:504-1541(+)
MEVLKEAVEGRQATEDVKLYAVWAVEYLKFSQKDVAVLYHKSEATISNWVRQFRSAGSLARKCPKRISKYDHEHREWIIDFVTISPLSYLWEIQKKFEKSFDLDISISTICVLLQEGGFTKKVAERRAMEVSVDSISRFTIELNSLDFCADQLLFLDEFFTDNRSMLRKHGWFLRGQRPVIKSCFQRGQRISILAFLGVDGIVENYETSGTFDHLTFFDCCKSLLDSGKVQPYPGKRSIWILDGASIHVDNTMVEYFYSRGIFLVYLPAYSPFFNPIEVIFSLIKRKCRELNKIEGTERFILQSVLADFSTFNAQHIFQHCGYKSVGVFDPNINYTLLAETADWA